MQISHRLIEALSRRSPDGGDAERIAASVGIAVSAAGRGSAEKLLDEADTAMYKAKALGGARAAIYDAALGRQMQQRSRAQRMVQSALDEHRITVRYQPIVSVASERVSGFEALARIARRDGSIVLPAAFIPAAEDSGLVVPLGAQVLETAFGEASRWRSGPAAAPALSVAVNLSSRQLEPGTLTGLVVQGLKRTGLDARCLHLEVTETAIMDLDAHVLTQLQDIRDLGVEIGLDDFGTGYASLIHLRRLPLTFVKIDQSFVHGLGNDQEDERIVSAVVELAANLGLRSIAEGVETEHQLARLREFGCDQAPGHLFARPLSAEAIPQAIRGRPGRRVRSA